MGSMTAISELLLQFFRQTSVFSVPHRRERIGILGRTVELEGTSAVARTGKKSHGQRPNMDLLILPWTRKKIVNPV